MRKKIKILITLGCFSIVLGLADIYLLKNHEGFRAQSILKSDDQGDAMNRLSAQVKAYTSPLRAMKGMMKPKFLINQIEAETAALKQKIAAADMKVVPDKNLAGKKLIALTFDDGPKPETTAELLQYLKDQQVPATFFVLGSQANRYPDLVKQAYDNGNQIGSHTYNHLNLPKLSAAQQKDEIDQTDKVIQKIIGKHPNMLRPPYGAFDNQVAQVAHAGLALWNVDSLDWQSKNAEAIYQTVMANVTDGSIILMHDIYSTSVAGAKRIIPALKQQGYTFVTVNQLIGARSEFKAGQAYYEVTPDGKIR
jgi:peptidoglycan/xylan/chitin deacetylase (PgdA/CDA1 family)